jgi:pimeloyl-ACP methyl ester carboxylesterase
MAISIELGAERTVATSAGTIAYRERGEGPPLVFVHGVFVNGDLWRKVVPLLAADYRCITLDLPLGSHRYAMARSADLSTPGLAKLVGEVLEKLDLHGVTLVGNDTGGAICQVLMASGPDRVGRAVLTSCDAFEVFPPEPFAFLRLVPRVPGSAWILAQAMRFHFVRALPTGFGWVTSTLPPKEILDSYTQPLLRADIRRDSLEVLRGVSPEHTLEAAKKLPGFKGPVLLAWGADDRLFPMSLAERLRDVLPSAQLRPIQGARTFVAEDRPEALVLVMREFLAATAKAASVEGAETGKG